MVEGDLVPDSIEAVLEGVAIARLTSAPATGKRNWSGSKRIGGERKGHIGIVVQMF
jgi:hypothetical protein